MGVSIGILDLVLYCIQQVGVMLAVGAATIVLITYVIAMRDGKTDENEMHFARTIHRALVVGMFCMVGSGVGILLLHANMGEQGIILEPVFLFKWSLILSLIFAYVWQKGTQFSHFLFEGWMGSTWYALFLVHILAPVTSWGNLVFFYVVWTLLFSAIWYIVLKISHIHIAMPVLALQGSNQRPQAPVRVFKSAPPAMQVAHTTPEIPVPIPLPPPPPPVVVSKPLPPPPPPKPIPPPAPLPVVAIPVPLPVVTAPPLPPPLPPVIIHAEEVHDPHKSLWLPAIHVMPRSQEVLDARSHVTPLAAITKTA